MSVYRHKNALLLLVSSSHLVNHLNTTAITFLISLIVASELQLSKTEIGLVASAATVTAGLLQLGFGVVGRYYARRVLLAAGNALMALGSVLTGLAVNLQQLLTFRLIWGIGSAPQHPLGAALISDGFERQQRGRALGIHSGLAYFGNIAGPLVAIATAGLLGWRTALSLLAVPLVVIIAPLLIGIRERPSESLNPGAGHERLSLSMTRALRDRNLAFITLTQAVVAGGRGLGVTFVFLPVFLQQDVGFDTAATTFLTTIFLVGGGAGPFVYGWLSDRMGRKLVTILTILMTGVLTYALVLSRQAGLALPLLLFALGSVSLAVTSLLQAYLAETIDSSIRDIAFGVYFTLGFGVTSFWTLLVGAVSDLYGFDAAWTLMAVLSVLAAAFVLPVAARQVAKAGVIVHE